MTGRCKRPLGDIFGISNFGVNLCSLSPGSISSLLHKHLVQDEWIYVLEGQITLISDLGEHVVEAGMCVGFPAGGSAHQLMNRTETVCTYLEVGDRGPGDVTSYPEDDLQAVANASGAWQFCHKDGQPYELNVE